MVSVISSSSQLWEEQAIHRTHSIFSIAFIAVAVAVAGCSSLSAHDLVLIVHEDGTLLIKFGEPGEYERADLHRLIELNAYFSTADESVSLLEEKFEPKLTDWLARPSRERSADKRLSLVAGRYDNGYWIDTAGGREFNTSKLGLPGQKDAGHYFKFGKGLASASGAAFNQIVGHRLEIVPQADPFTLKSGEALAVQVLWEGKPLAKAGVAICDGITKLKEAEIAHCETGPDGIAKVPVGKGGLQIITVDHQIAPLHPDLSDHDDFSASLTFVSKERP